MLKASRGNFKLMTGKKKTQLITPNTVDHRGEKTGQPGNIKELRNEISRRALKSSRIFLGSRSHTCMYSCVHVRERSKAALCKQEAEEKVRVPTTWLGAKGTPSTHRLLQRLGDLLVPSSNLDIHQQMNG